MKVLFIGGTGLISTEVTRLLLSRGHSVALLNAAVTEFEELGAECLIADIRTQQPLNLLSLADRLTLLLAGLLMNQRMSYEISSFSMG